MERKLIEERKLILEDYRHSRALCLGVGLLMALLLAALICAGVGLGAMEISYRQVLAIIWAKFSGNGAQLSQAGAHAAAVVWEIRLPRIICGVFVGAGLAIAGVMFQAILQNPLADPYTLGISTGAAFGASLAIFLNITWGLLLPVPLLALAFALATLAAVIAISLRGGGLVSANLIIAGIIVSAILSAGISFIKMLAGENVSAIVYWLMGSLGSREWGDAALVAPVVLIGFTLAFIFANDLNVMTLGNKNAEALGVNVRRLRLFYLLLAAAITAVSVSVCGIIGFIGLIVPHILRFWLTSDNRRLLPLSALFGGLLLAAADNAARLISNGEIPVGVLTTLLGGPFFIYIFLKRKGGVKYE